MKSIVLFLSVLSLVSASAFASNDSSTAREESTYSAPSSKNLFTLEAIGSSSKVSSSTTILGQTTSDSTSGTSFGGVAAGLTLKSNSGFAFEGNLALLNKKFNKFTDQTGTNDFTGDANAKMTTLRMTAMARYYLAPTFSLGAGAYASRFLGNIKNTDENGVTTNTSYEESGLYRNDFGLAFGGRAELPMTSNLSFVADARYFLGLANLVNVDMVRNSLVSELMNQGATFSEAYALAQEVNASAKTRDLQFGAGIAYKF